MVMTTSRPPQTPVIDPATVAPAAPNAAVAAVTTSKTARSWPPSSTRRAIPVPMRPRPMKPTFIALRQLPLDPIHFAADVFDDVAGLEVIGKHVPGVSLDLQVRGERRFLVERQRLLERVPRRPERAKVVEEDRDMKVRAPVARTGVLVPVLEGVLEIHEPG